MIKQKQLSIVRTELVYGRISRGSVYIWKTSYIELKLLLLRMTTYSAMSMHAWYTCIYI